MENQGETQEQTDQNLKALEVAIKDPNAPKIYANGFMLGMGTGDTTILFQCNGQPVVVLNVSYTIAKTLAIKLGKMINDLEDKSSNKIMTTDDITNIMGKPNDTKEAQE